MRVKEAQSSSESSSDSDSSDNENKGPSLKKLNGATPKAVTQEHPCPQCKKSFASKSQLDQHMTTHSNQRFTCPVCLMKVKWKLSLKRHATAHGKEGAVAFNWTKVLPDTEVVPSEKIKNRMSASIKLKKTKDEQKKEKKKKVVTTPKEKRKSISGPQSFIMCEVCGEKYVAGTAFSSHSRSHKVDSAKPNQICLHCGAQYLMPKTCKLHVGTHDSKITAFQCDLCSKYFISDAFVNSHKSNYCIYSYKSPKFNFFRAYEQLL